MAEKRWSIRAGRTIHRNPWRTIREYDAVAPTGVEATYSIVNFHALAIGVLPIDDEGHTYLIGQHRFATGQYSWELPEGGGDINVSPLDTAKRELAEEAKLTAANWNCLFENLHVSNSLTDERATAFLATGLSAGEGHRDDVEDLEVLRLPVSHAFEMALSGQITDMFSVLMLHHARYLAETQTDMDLLKRAFGV